MRALREFAWYEVRYGRIAVSYLPELDGGGMSFGQRIVPAVRQRLGHVRHAFEFCAGPGFMGFSLLAQGLCDRLTLADVNPAAVQACERTIRLNGLEDRVKVYLSDGLKDIPRDERWDLVIGNPPHWPGTVADYEGRIRLVDPGFEIHRRFYRDVSAFLEPGASVMLLENGHASQPDEFVPMARESGLRVIDVFDTSPLGALTRWLPRAPNPVRHASRNAFHRLLAPVEKVLMSDAVERLVKDTDLYRAVSTWPVFTPSPFYVLWTKWYPQQPAPMRTERANTGSHPQSARAE